MCSICLITFGVSCLFNAYGYYLINKKLKEIKSQIRPPVTVQHQDNVGIFTDDKFENIRWIPKEEYYNNLKSK